MLFKHGLTLPLLLQLQNQTSATLKQIFLNLYIKYNINIYAMQAFLINHVMGELKDDFAIPVELVPAKAGMADFP